MTHALVTQLLNALEYHQSQTRPIHNTELAVEAAREYLATEPIGGRASLIRRANTSVTALDSRIMEPFYCALDQDASRVLSDCTDMLEADADLRTQLARRTVERDMVISMLSDMLEADAQQAITGGEVQNKC